MTAFFSLVLSGLAFSQPVVVVSSSSPIVALTASQASEIFLGRLNKLPDGFFVVPIEQSEGNLSRQEFHASVTKKSEPMLKAHWSRIIFTGRGQPPREAADDAAVKRLLSENPNAIGYIDRNSVDSTVRIVLSPQGK